METTKVKLIRRIRSDDLWNIGEHESWLSDMSREGYHLVRLGSFFAYFEVGVPKEINYRFLISTEEKGDINEEPYIESQVEISGWQFISQTRSLLIYASPAKDGAPEPCANSVESLAAWKKLEWQYFFAAALVFLFVLLYLRMGVNKSLWRPFQLLTIRSNSFFGSWFSIMVFAYLTYNHTRAFLNIHKIRKQLASDGQIDHHQPWRKSRRRSLFLAGAALFIGLNVVLLQPISHLFVKKEELPINSTNLPLVRLSDLEPNTKLVRKPNEVFEGMIFGNQCLRFSNFLVPVSYELSDEATVAGRKWSDGSSEIYAPNVSMQIYKLRFESMNQGIMKELMGQYGEDFNGKFVEKKSSRFDRLMILDDKYSKRICAIKGDVVAVVWYTGESSMDLLLNKLDEKMTMLTQ